MDSNPQPGQQRPALDDLFGERVDLPGGGHADTLRDPAGPASYEDEMEESYRRSCNSCP